MYISVMAMKKENFIQTLDQSKDHKSDLAHLIKQYGRLDTLHTAFQLRQDIIKSVKVLVGLDIMDLFRSVKFADVGEHVWGKKNPSDEYIRAKQEQYAQFARMPFDLMFIENWTGGHLLRKNADGITWTQTTFHHVYEGPKDDHALNIGVDYIVDPTRVDDDGFLHVQPVHSKAMQDIANKGNKEISRSMERLFSTQAAEALLFMNVKNMEMQRYTATKSEIKREQIPKVFERYCDYRILDIYRNNEPIRNIGDLLKVAIEQSKGEKENQTRAHLVRGHFKRIHGGLYWWNPFMRNRKNLETRGFVDKDYRFNK